ncbi:uncharacterized protein LOC109705728 isoform X2 [Ananas comosus]|uniref:Uncharacterized protein LOC109705728 isoform X2 n=1 Tax=Ananas comosus TaxID=4615 RepID=A0A6P5EF92_ANACO|nr:uncharacterized protein LOC109705728 isoform X2 [Ananas comosus]
MIMRGKKMKTSYPCENLILVPISNSNGSQNLESNLSHMVSNISVSRTPPSDISNSNSVLCFSNGDKRSTHHFERTSITYSSFSSIIHPDYVNTSNTYFPPQIRVGKHIIQDKNVLESLSWNANKDVEFSMLDKDLKDGANTRGPNHLGFCANHIVDEGSSIDYMQKKNARLKRSLIMSEKCVKIQKHAAYIDVDVDEEESQYNLDATVQVEVLMSLTPQLLTSSKVC